MHDGTEKGLGEHSENAKTITEQYCHVIMNTSLFAAFYPTT